MKLSFLLVFSFLCFTQCVLCSSNSWDFLLYVVQWPGSVDQSGVPKGVNSFTLHGVWPTNNDTTYPEDCPGPGFSMSAIKSLVPQLNTSWPSLEGDEGNEAFWCHEWDKHGTCATNGQIKNLTTELAYFTFDLSLHSRFNFLNILERAGVKPSSSTPYTLDQYVTPLLTNLSVNPIPTCEESDGKLLLETLEFCVTNSGELFMCNKEFYDKSVASNGCGSSTKIYFPPIDTKY